MTCFDIGANTGTVSIHIGNKVGKTGKAHCFEPIPHIYRQLSGHIVRNGQQAVCFPHQIALSNVTGVATINMAEEKAENQGIGSLVNSEHPKLIKHIEIETITIDQFVKQQGITCVDFMKIDIQGGEVLLFRGGPDFFSLSQAPDLMVEVSPSDLRPLGLDSKDQLRIIQDYGYSIYLVTRQGNIGHRISADTVEKGFSAANVYCTKRTLL